MNGLCVILMILRKRCEWFFVCLFVSNIKTENLIRMNNKNKKIQIVYLFNIRLSCVISLLNSILFRLINLLS